MDERAPASQQLEPPVEPWVRFLPEMLGLDLGKRKDAIVFTDSEGDLRLAELLLAQRTCQDRLDAGTDQREVFDRNMAGLQDLIMARRDELGLPTPPPAQA